MILMCEKIAANGFYPFKKAKCQKEMKMSDVKGIQDIDESHIKRGVGWG